MNKSRLLFFLTALLLLCVTGMFSYLMTAQQKIRWIDLPKVYDQFSYKKQLEKELTGKEAYVKRYIDSLDMAMLSLSEEVSGRKNKQVDQFDIQRRNAILSEKRRLEQDIAGVKENYESKISIQLNQYLKDYAEKNNVDILLGAEGSGVVLYGGTDYEATESVINYINKRYSGEGE